MPNQMPCLATLVESICTMIIGMPGAMPSLRTSSTVPWNASG